MRKQPLLHFYPSENSEPFPRRSHVLPLCCLRARQGSPNENDTKANSDELLNLLQSSAFPANIYLPGCNFLVSSLGVHAYIICQVLLFYLSVDHPSTMQLHPN